MAVSNYLLDSHALLWLLQEPQKVGRTVTSYLKQADTVYVSLASIWELGAKHAKNKLDLSASELLMYSNSMGAQTLGITTEHVLGATSNALWHGDPFDRMLLAQAKAEQLTFITADKTILDFNLEFVMDASL